MRHTALFFSSIMVLSASSSLAQGLGVPSDDSEWPNYTWPRNQAHERMYEPDYGTTERYNDAMRDVERSLEGMSAPQPQAARPPMPAQPPATAYPPRYQTQPMQGRAYPPTYNNRMPQPPAQPIRAPSYQAPAGGQSYYQQPVQPPQQMAAAPQAYAPPQPYNPQGLSRERRQSQAQYQRPSSENWKMSFGAGLGYVPEFEGSDQNNVMVLPMVDVSYKDTFFINTSLGAGMNVYNRNGLRAGPYATLDFGRDSDDAPYLAGAEDVDPTLESGVFVEKNFEPFNFLWTARYAILNEGHGGFISDAELSYNIQIQPGFYGTLGASLSWASEDYMVSYFGVSANHAAQSGLRQYTPDSGVKDIGLSGSLHYVLDKQISFLASLGVTRLRGQAHSSPIVEAGNNIQWHGATGMMYHF